MVFIDLHAEDVFAHSAHTACSVLHSNIEVTFKEFVAFDFFLSETVVEAI